MVAIGQSPSEEEVDKVLQVSKKLDTVIFSTFNVEADSVLLELMRQMSDLGKQVVVMAMRNPYHLAYMPKVNAFVATYEWTKVGLELAAKVIFGMEDVSGKLPVMKNY